MMKYKISDVSAITSISPETIRFYEKKGLLLPKKEKANGYRSYSIHDIILLIKIKSYRDYGYSISKIDQLINDYEIDTLVEEHLIQEKILEEEIKKKIEYLKILKERREGIEWGINNLGVFTREKIPKTYVIEILKPEEETVLNNLQKSIVSQWSHMTPYIFPCIIYDKDCLDHENEENCKTRGLAIEAIHYDKLEVLLDETPSIIEEINAVSVTLETPSLDTSAFANLEAGLKYLEDNNLELTGNIFSKIYLIRKTSDDYILYQKVWFPYRKK